MVSLAKKERKSVICECDLVSNAKPYLYNGGGPEFLLVNAMEKVRDPPENTLIPPPPSPLNSLALAQGTLVPGDPRLALPD